MKNLNGQILLLGPRQCRVVCDLFFSLYIQIPRVHRWIPTVDEVQLILEIIRENHHNRTDEIVRLLGERLHMLYNATFVHFY